MSPETKELVDRLTVLMNHPVVVGYPDSSRLEMTSNTAAWCRQHGVGITEHGIELPTAEGHFTFWKIPTNLNGDSSPGLFRVCLDPVICDVSLATKLKIIQQ